MSRQRLNRACKKTASKSPESNSVDPSPTIQSNLDKAARNIALESKKCNYNTEIDMNWCNLPMEMRNECLKRMDFKTRTRFGATSKSEKSLVDWRKRRFGLVRLNLNSFYEKWTLEPYSEDISYHSPESTDLFISAIFKNCEIENIWIQGSVRLGVDVPSYPEMRILEQFVKFAPFQFKRVSVFGMRSSGILIKNCENVEKIDFYGKRFGFPCKQILEVPNLMNIKEFRISDVNYQFFIMFLKGIVQKWIDNDVEFGKSVQFHVKGDREDLGEIIDTFTETFADRPIEKNDKIVRIRMNNPTTQIMLRQIGVRRNSAYWHYCSCKVVPIDMPESKYGKGDEWIQAVYEKDLKKDGKLENSMEFDAEDQAVWGHLYP